ncbi:type II toxin-antitoxin system RelE/ParE family toxin [Nitrospirillum sp. BR 11828]|uniref:type II toxin-antitoxin system RelE/ParE family toxin n=1 Tax=Nitrospirillum sp. BR 11828 TaxID=3104325 RepID=UPI002ACACFBA|nr:type II toxin-antitoxin system RelE/ParE family toxin [Nitrospirillum sp. BR 11828]MDZ5646423.1 type II toxin-antitoxin system RelE/ParE family toxin [Nitrospirillum sp. BR 11828]
MSERLHTVVETPQYLRDAAGAGLSEAERKGIVDIVAMSPRQGVEIQGSGGVRKFRVAGRGKGKSGGYRVISAYFGPDIPVYLLALLSKGERGNFSDAEIAGFKAVTTLIARYWRERVRK